MVVVEVTFAVSVGVDVIVSTSVLVLVTVMLTSGGKIVEVDVNVVIVVGDDVKGFAVFVSGDSVLVTTVVEATWSKTLQRTFSGYFPIETPASGFGFARA